MCSFGMIERPAFSPYLFSKYGIDLNFQKRVDIMVQFKKKILFLEFLNDLFF